jgi:hypothetical protein
MTSPITRDVALEITLAYFDAAHDVRAALAAELETVDDGYMAGLADSLRDSTARREPNRFTARLARA